MPLRPQPYRGSVRDHRTHPLRCITSEQLGFLPLRHWSLALADYFKEVVQSYFRNQNQSCVLERAKLWHAASRGRNGVLLLSRGGGCIAL